MDWSNHGNRPYSGCLWEVGDPWNPWASHDPTGASIWRNISKTPRTTPRCLVQSAPSAPPSMGRAHVRIESIGICQTDNVSRCQLLSGVLSPEEGAYQTDQTRIVPHQVSGLSWLSWGGIWNGLLVGARQSQRRTKIWDPYNLFSSTTNIGFSRLTSLDLFRPIPEAMPKSELPHIDSVWSCLVCVQILSPCWCSIPMSIESIRASQWHLGHLRLLLPVARPRPKPWPILSMGCGSKVSWSKKNEQNRRTSVWF